MTACHDIRGQLGEYLDGELSPAARSQVQLHLAACDPCRAELDELTRLAEAVGKADSVAIPDGLWVSVERRLNASDSTPPGVARLYRILRPARLATAAAIVLVVGLALTSLLTLDRSAGAAEINFTVLLDALPFDVDDAFAKFITHNHGERTTPAEALAFATALNFATPDELPGGFRLKEVYALRVGSNPGVAARYERNGELLGAIFHPPVKREDFGSHKDYPCVIGKHRGHAVAVGQWKLVHLTDPTTCHCVLSRLDEETELPAIMRRLAPAMPDNGAAAPPNHAPDPHRP